jgi:hypothetical protein
MTLIAIEHSTSTKRLSDISKPVLFPLYHSVHILTVSGDHRKSRKRSRNQPRTSSFQNQISVDPNCQLPIAELELIQTQMAQKPMLRAEVGMRVRCANKASAE